MARMALVLFLSFCGATGTYAQRGSGISIKVVNHPQKISDSVALEIEGARFIEGK